MTSEEIDALWDYSKPAESCERFRSALADAPENADEIRTQICRCFGLQRRFEDGWAELAKVKAETPIVRVRVALESGRLKNSSGDKAAAKPFFLHALELAEAHQLDFYAVDAAHMLGIATTGMESLEWNEKAIRMAAASTDPRARRWQGSLLNNTGWTYHDIGEFEKALELFQRALEVRQEVGAEEPIRIARWAVARCLRSLGRYDEALAIQRELAQFPDEGYVSEELGELLLATGREEESKPHFKRAYEMLSQDEFLKANEGARLERLKQLAGEEPQVIGEVEAGIHRLLGERLLALYLYGSYVVGDFDPEVSDLDFLAMLASPPTEDDIPELAEFHAAIESRNPEWKGRIEVIYASPETFRGETGIVAKISPGEPLHLVEVDRLWVVNWYLVRETSRILRGPSPKEFILEISQERYLEAVRDEAQAWLEHVREITVKPGHSYAVLTLCRILYAAEHGRQASKPVAAEYAATVLPQYHDLIERALLWRKNVFSLDFSDLSAQAEVEAFAKDIASRVAAAKAASAARV